MNNLLKMNCQMLMNKMFKDPEHSWKNSNCESFLWCGTMSPRFQESGQLSK